MSAFRLSVPLLAALVFFVRPASCLPTDQDINAMFSSAAQMDAAGSGAARDAIIQDIRTALRSRLAVDSGTESASRFLELLDEVLAEQTSTRERLVRELKTQTAKGDTNGIRTRLSSLQKRYPGASLPTLGSILALLPASAASPSAPATPQADSCPPTGCTGDSLATPASSQQKAPPVCPAGPPSAEFLQPAPTSSLRESDSALLLTMRIIAPCALSSLELQLDSQKVRSLAIPSGKPGEFEFDDAVTVTPRSREVALIACDTFATCSRAVLRVPRKAPIPPWIPWSCGGLVVLGLATGILALFRRPAAPGASSKAQGVLVRPAALATATATGKLDIALSLRQLIATAEKDLPRGPRVVSRLGALPPIDGDLPALESALTALLQLPIARAGLRGTVLIATGRGPVSMEVVIEDNGPDVEDGALRQLFDPACAKLRDRQALDRDLLAAADIIMRHNGHLSAESRIDGGLRLRLRLPLPSATGPRATSLLK